MVTLVCHAFPADFPPNIQAWLQVYADLIGTRGIGPVSSAGSWTLPGFNRAIVKRSQLQLYNGMDVLLMLDYFQLCAKCYEEAGQSLGQSVGVACSLPGGRFEALNYSHAFGKEVVA